ncbi:response regulator [Hyphobacterium sp.]|uniref:response regulator n=1 Tax=Hyphobacterium sp. TaxID=2004662 RepID=UPI003BAA4643
MSALNVLHVEDDFADALLVQNTVFEAGDYEIGFEVARNLGDARRKLKQKCYDLVLLDLRLPDSLDPRDTFDSVKNMCPVTPIVVLSGSVRVDSGMLPEEITQLDKNRHLCGRVAGPNSLAQILRDSACGDEFEAV